jgi:small-conductance mechanosensitive channel
MKDPVLSNLLLSTLLLMAALAIPRLRPGWPVWLRMTIRIGAFIGLTALIAQGTGSPLSPRWDVAEPDRQLWQQAIEAGWWLLAGRVAVGAVRLFVVLKNRPRETRILSDLLAGAVYVATLLSIVTFAFAIPLGGLLATSGVIAIVLGLALQSTLSDLFSGVAVGLEKPYAAGDQVWIEGGIEGQVVDVNWRSTRIATIDNNLAVIPNSVIAKARLVNRSAPTPRRGSSVEDQA